MNNPIYNRNKPKPSTFTVPQQSQPPQSQPSKQEQVKLQHKPPVEIDTFLNVARRDSTKVDIGLVNGKEYLGATIKHVERYMVVLAHDGKEIGIMKTAIASVAR